MLFKIGVQKATDFLSTTILVVMAELVWKLANLPHTWTHWDVLYCVQVVGVIGTPMLVMALALRRTYAEQPVTVVREPALHVRAVRPNRKVRESARKTRTQKPNWQTVSAGMSKEELRWIVSAPWQEVAARYKLPRRTVFDWKKYAERGV